MGDAKRALIGLICAMPAVASADEAHEAHEVHDELAVHVPEPMMFDLVRGLGSHQGEFEVNTLARPPLNKFAAQGLEWAPEVEFAVADGVGLELELPIHNGTLEAFKFAGQGTFSGLFRRHFLHGVQVIVEKVRGKEGIELSTLYIPVVRFNQTWSSLMMFGLRTAVGADMPEAETFLMNGCLFAEPNRNTALGLEVNVSAQRGERTTVLLMPQIEHEFDHHWTVQAGVGAEFGNEDGTHFLAGVRVVWATAFHLHKQPKGQLGHATSRR